MRLLLIVQEIFVGLDAGVPTSTYRFSPAVKVLFEVKTVVPTVVEELFTFVQFVPSPKRVEIVPASVKHWTPFHVSATYAVPSGMVVVPVQAVVVA